MDIAGQARVNERMPGADKEARTIEPWAAGIGMGTLILVATVAVFTAWDRAHTATHERAVTPTAVGDTHYVPEPATRIGPLGLSYEGRKLDMLSENKIRDSKLIRVGADDSGAYSLYRPQDESEGLPKEHFYMKAKPNEFLEVTAE